MTSTNGAAQFSTARSRSIPRIDDVDVQPPEQQEGEPLGRRVPVEAGAEQRVPAGHDRSKERMERFAADPGLDAEPAAGDQRAHQCGQVRADRAVRGTREDRKRNAVAGARVRVEQDRDQHDRVAEEDRDERLPPVHAGRHQPRREHVGGNAVRHADPQRGVVVGRPRAPRDRQRREVLVVERASSRLGSCRSARRGHPAGDARCSGSRGFLRAVAFRLPT